MFPTHNIHTNFMEFTGHILFLFLLVRVMRPEMIVFLVMEILNCIPNSNLHSLIYVLTYRINF